MGREMRRKNSKKNKNLKIKNELPVNDTITGRSALKIFVFSTILLAAIYFTIAIFVTKELKISWLNGETNETESTTIENKILAKNTFNQRESTYYVYFYDFNNEDTNIASAIYGADARVYRVDASNGLNSNYVSTESGNRNATTLDDLKVVDPTLIKIDNDKIVAYYEGPSEIMSFLN